MVNETQLFSALANVWRLMLLSSVGLPTRPYKCISGPKVVLNEQHWQQASDAVSYLPSSRRSRIVKRYFHLLFVFGTTALNLTTICCLCFHSKQRVLEASYIRNSASLADRAVLGAQVDPLVLKISMNMKKQSPVTSVKYSPKLRLTDLITLSVKN